MTTQTLPLARFEQLVRSEVKTTPGRLKLALVSIWFLALLFFSTTRAGVHEHREAMKTIGKDAAPSIVAAQQIRADLADMHSNAANYLLGESKRTVEDYEMRRAKATDGLLAAAENITYGDAERLPLKRLLNQLGRYEAVMAQAFILHVKGDPDFLAKHRDGDTIMQKELLPAADALEKANRDELDRAYQSHGRTSSGALGAVILLGLALLGCLVATQWFLTRHMHRLVNPALLAATAAVAVFLIYTIVTFQQEASYLKLAKEDAFESIHALWRARAFAYDANGDESRWLLDRKHSEEYQKDFDAKSARIAELPEGFSWERLVADVDKKTIPRGFKGYLADELRNITFAGEREAAVKTLKAFAAYYAIDGRIRRLEQESKHSEAVALCVGYGPGQSNGAFEEFDKALGDTLDINQKHFERLVQEGPRVLTRIDFWNPVIALGVACLAFLGLRPRLKEYAL